MSDIHIAALSRTIDVDLDATYETADRLLTDWATPELPVDTRHIARSVGCQLEEVSEAEWFNAPAPCRDLFAFYQSQDRTIWVRTTGSHARLQTAIAHEIGHDQIPSQAMILRHLNMPLSRIRPRLWKAMEAQARAFSFYLRVGGSWFTQSTRTASWGLAAPMEQARLYNVSPIMALQQYVQASSRPCVLRLFESTVDSMGQRQLRFRRYMTSRLGEYFPHAVPVHSLWPTSHVISSLAQVAHSGPCRDRDTTGVHEVCLQHDMLYALSW